jgi:hypothetical protein
MSLKIKCKMRKFIIGISTLFFTVSLMAQTDSLATDSIVVTEEQNTVPPQQEPETKPKKEKNNGGFSMSKVTFGLNGSASFGSYTYLYLAPRIGYYVTNTTVVGTQFIYQYTSDNRNSVNEKIVGHSYGTGLWARQFVLKKFFLHGEWETINRPVFTISGTEIQEDREWVNSLMVGAGYYKRISKKGGVSASVLYIVNYDENHSPYSSPWIFRIGVFL